MSKVKIAASLIFAAFLLSSCTSSQTYAKNKNEGVYFTLPNGWTKISQSALNDREKESKNPADLERLSRVTWQEAYSKKGEATAKEVFSLKSPKSPLVYVRVRDLSMSEVQSISYNLLRDIIVPLTTWINDGNSAQSFALINDFEVVEKKARGVHSIYSFVGSDGIDQTVNQVSMVSDDRTKLYVLIVRAKTEDYLASEKELNKIADSLTIRGAK